MWKSSKLKLSPLASKCSQNHAAETDSVLTRYPQHNLACRLLWTAVLFKTFHPFLTPCVGKVFHHQLHVQFLTD